MVYGDLAGNRPDDCGRVVVGPGAYARPLLLGGGMRGVNGAEGAPVTPSQLEDADGAPVTSWTFTVPAPCKFINLNSRTHWAPKAQMTKAWRNAAHVAARNANIPKGLERVHVVAHVIKPTSREYDVHNLMPTLKAAIDGIVTDYGLIPDDTNAHLIGPDLRQGGKGPAAVIITISQEKT